MNHQQICWLISTNFKHLPFDKYYYLISVLITEVSYISVLVLASNILLFFCVYSFIYLSLQTPPLTPEKNHRSRAKMSHSVTITRTTTSTTNTSYIVLNTGYLKTFPGILKLFELVR